MLVLSIGFYIKKILLPPRFFSVKTIHAQIDTQEFNWLYEKRPQDHQIDAGDIIFSFIDCKFINYFERKYPLRKEL